MALEKLTQVKGSVSLYLRQLINKTISGTTNYLGYWGLTLSNSGLAGATVKFGGKVWELRSDNADISSSEPSDELWIDCGTDGFTFKSLADAKASLRIEGQGFYISSYHEGLNKGGGWFTWVPSSTAVEDDFLVIGTGSAGRHHRSVENGTVTPSDAGARGEGASSATQDTLAFLKVAACDYNVTCDYTDAGYYLTNQVSLSGTRRNWKIINLNGCDIQFVFDGSSSRNCFQMGDFSEIYGGTLLNNTDPSNSNGDGSFDNPVAVGTTANVAAKNVKIHTLEIYQNLEKTCIGIWGASHDIEVDNIFLRSSERATIGVLAHWGVDTGDFTTASVSLHPYNLKMSNVTCKNFSGLAADSFAIFLSGVYNVTVDNLTAENMIGGCKVQPGTVGNSLASAEVREKILTNIRVNNINTFNVQQPAFADWSGDGVAWSGGSYDIESDIEFDGVNANESPTGGTAFIVQRLSNVTAKNLRIKNFFRAFHVLGIDGDEASDVTIDDLKAEDIKTIGGYVSGVYCKRFKLTSSEIKDCSDGISTIANESSCLLIESPDFTIENTRLGADSSEDAYRLLALTATATGGLVKGSEYKDVRSGGYHLFNDVPVTTQINTTTPDGFNMLSSNVVLSRLDYVDVGLNLSSNQSVSTGVSSTLNLDSVDHDYYSNYSSLGFLPKTSSMYTVEGLITLRDVLGEGTVNVDVYSGSTRIKRLVSESVNLDSSRNAGVKLSGSFKAEAGSVITLKLTQDIAASLELDSDNNTGTWVDFRQL